MTAFQIHSPAELPELAKKLLLLFPTRRVFALRGPMGAGKTTFIKALCKELGAEDQTSSPSFSIVNEYKAGSGKKFYHFDFYRISNEKEASDMGLEEYLESGSYCFIEWPEKAGGLLPETCLYIDIKVSSEVRSISFSTSP
ncbi:MAG: tRNA (adenosine(37)-N6)-threonylcarbamoyltransferase complex ATPase subunit type 1 TsaE [Bacteroidia bacterium]